MDGSFERDASDIPFKALSHKSPTLHEKTCSNVSWSCLQKGHNRFCAYLFLTSMHKFFWQVCTTNFKRIPITSLSITSQNNLLLSTLILFVVYLYTFVSLYSPRDHNENKVYHWPVLCHPCHRIFSCIVFLCSFFQLAFHDDFNVTGSLSFFSTVTLFFCWRINTHWLTHSLEVNL